MSASTSQLTNWSSVDVYVQWAGGIIELVANSGVSSSVDNAITHTLVFMNPIDPKLTQPVYLPAYNTMYTGINQVATPNLTFFYALQYSGGATGVVYTGIIAVYTTNAITLINASRSQPALPPPVTLTLHNQTPYSCLFQYTFPGPSSPSPAPNPSSVPGAVAAASGPWTNTALTPDATQWLLQNCATLTCQFTTSSPSAGGGDTWLAEINVLYAPINPAYTRTFSADYTQANNIVNVPITFMTPQTFVAPGTLVNMPVSAVTRTTASVAVVCTPDFLNNTWHIMWQFAGPWQMSSVFSGIINSTMTSFTNLTSRPYVIARKITQGPGPPQPFTGMDTLQPTIDSPNQVSTTLGRTQTLQPGQKALVLFAPPGPSDSYTYFSVIDRPLSPDESTTPQVFMTLPVNLTPQGTNITSIFGAWTDPAGVLPPLYLNAFPAGRGYPGITDPLTARGALEIVLTDSPPVVVRVNPTPPTSTAPSFWPVLVYPKLAPPVPGSAIVQAQATSTSLGQTLPTAVVALVGYKGPLVFTVNALAEVSTAVAQPFEYNSMPATTFAVSVGPSGPYVEPGVVLPATVAPQQNGTVLTVQVQQTALCATLLTGLQSVTSCKVNNVPSPNYFDNVCVQGGFQDCRAIAGVPQSSCIGFFSSTVGNPCSTACGGREYAQGSYTGNDAIDGPCLATFSGNYCGVKSGDGTYEPDDALDKDLACACVRRETSDIKFDIGGSGTAADAMTYKDYKALLRTLLAKAGQSASILDASSCWWPPCNSGYTSALPDTYAELQCTQSFTNCFAAVGKYIRDPTSIIQVDIDNACGTTDSSSQNTFAGNGASGASSGSSIGGAGRAGAAKPTLSDTMTIVVIVGVLCALILIVGLAIGLTARKRRRQQQQQQPGIATS
jgi:hypothetical protein